MSLLDHLWDDTVAGPRPENGLEAGAAGNVRSYGGDLSSAEDAMKVTRSIMILKPNGYNQSQNESAPASPAGSTPPVSPFSGGREPFVRFRRRSTTDAYEKGKTGQNRPSPSSPFDV